MQANGGAPMAHAAFAVVVRYDACPRAPRKQTPDPTVKPAQTKRGPRLPTLLFRCLIWTESRTC